ncbi:lipid phosphate phosphatase epsilon 1, chloroplastic [Juglans microcarpa x Juglans regia]|uniref:lipid phosphate phosphatase epsilon 1, chloroplastic n=1 Tax=Juglans microcarpa x Juglans regia TaxID=2249226 RepID=UPI001B7DD97A|nr:lipid phosphate phosphatase epsilon 1, chloroplastic [Juglans microcarpa x Juglans regia]
MSSTANVLYRPPFQDLPSFRTKLKSINSAFAVGLSVSKSGSFGGFVSSKRFCDRNRFKGTNPMTELIKVSAFKGGDHDEGISVLSQETIVDGSSRFPREFMADGLEPTLNRMSKWLVAALFGGVILLRHDSEALWATMGSVVNSAFSLVLKRILNQERPVSTLRSDPGMPSSHAQSIFFTVGFSILSIVEWLGINDFTVIISILVLAFGSYLTWLRVSQQFHTVSQVVVGAVLGSIFCILWLWFWDAFVLQAFDSSLWVRIVVVLVAVGFCLGFLVHVVRNWFRDEIL